jgi:hypothetical protein
MTIRSGLVVVSCFIGLIGCGPGDEASSAEDADESAQIGSSESGLVSELSDEVAQPASASAGDVAAAAAMRVRSHLQPQGCLTATVNGPTVTYLFNDCTGPYGLVHLKGTVQGIYSHVGGVVQGVFTATGFQMNGAVVNINTTVKASIANGTKTAAVVAETNGTGPRGAALSRTGAYTVTFEATSECITLDGTWTTKVAARTATTAVTAYQRCKGSCPAAGGTIVHTTARGAVVTMTYDGSATATWATSTGKTGTVALKCGP